MAPGKKQRAKPASQKQLNSRITTSLNAAEEEAELIQAAAAVNITGNALLLPWKCLAYASCMDDWGGSNWFKLIHNYSLVTPIWVDQFSLDLQCNDNASQLLLPPLQQYTIGSPQMQQQGCDGHPDCTYSISDVLKLWQERHFKKRAQMEFQIASNSECMSDAAWGAYDLLPNTMDGWMERVKVAAAACEWATQQVVTKYGHLPQQFNVQQGLQPLQAAWLRALFLLARTIYGARLLFSTSCWHVHVAGNIARLLLNLLPDDPLGMRFMAMRLVSDRAAWDDLLALCNTHAGIGDCKVQDKLTLAVAYNKVLGAYYEHGGEHHITVTAVKVAFELDRCRWVPLMLAAGVLAAPVPGPLVALGSKEEATAYCSNYGMNWWEGSGVTADHNGFFQVPVTLSPALCWLLDRAGFEMLKEPLDKSRLAMMLYNTHTLEGAWRGSVVEVVNDLQRRYDNMGSPAARTVTPESRPVLLRYQLTLMCCLATRTANLPPVDAGEELWSSIRYMAGVPSMSVNEIKLRLVDCATDVHDLASKLILSSQANSDTFLGAAWPGELAHAARTLAELQPARVRWLWQAGEIRQAKDVAADLLKQQQWLHRRTHANSSSSSNDGTSGSSELASILEGTPLSPAPVLFSLAATQNMLDFLNQQVLEAARSGSKGGSSTARLNMYGSSRTAVSTKGSRAVISYAPIAAVEKADEFCNMLYNAAGGKAAVEAALLQGPEQQQQQPQQGELWLPYLLATPSWQQQETNQSTSGSSSGNSTARPAAQQQQQRSFNADDQDYNDANRQRNTRQHTNHAPGDGSSGSASSITDEQPASFAASSNSSSNDMAFRPAQTAFDVHGAYLLLNLLSEVQQLARHMYKLAEAAAAAAAGEIDSSITGSPQELIHALTKELGWVFQYAEAYVTVMHNTLSNTAASAADAGAAALDKALRMIMESTRKVPADAGAKQSGSSSSNSDGGSSSSSDSGDLEGDRPNALITRCRAFLAGCPAFCSVAAPPAADSTVGSSSSRQRGSSSSGSESGSGDLKEHFENAVAACMPMMRALTHVELWVTPLQPTEQQQQQQQQQHIDLERAWFKSQLLTLLDILQIQKQNLIQWTEQATDTVPQQQQQQERAGLPAFVCLWNNIEHTWCSLMPEAVAAVCDKARLKSNTARQSVKAHGYAAIAWGGVLHLLELTTVVAAVETNFAMLATRQQELAGWKAQGEQLPAGAQQIGRVADTLAALQPGAQQIEQLEAKQSQAVQQLDQLLDRIEGEIGVYVRPEQYKDMQQAVQSVAALVAAAAAAGGAGKGGASKTASTAAAAASTDLGSGAAARELGCTAAAAAGCDLLRDATAASGQQLPAAAAAAAAAAGGSDWHAGIADAKAAAAAQGPADIVLYGEFPSSSESDGEDQIEDFFDPGMDFKPGDLSNLHTSALLRLNGSLGQVGDVGTAEAAEAAGTSTAAAAAASEGGSERTPIGSAAELGAPATGIAKSSERRVLLDTATAAAPIETSKSVPEPSSTVVPPATFVFGCAGATAAAAASGTSTVVDSAAGNAATAAATPAAMMPQTMKNSASTTAGDSKGWSPFKFAAAVNGLTPPAPAAAAEIPAAAAVAQRASQAAGSGVAADGHSRSGSSSSGSHKASGSSFKFAAAVTGVPAAATAERTAAALCTGVPAADGANGSSSNSSGTGSSHKKGGSLFRFEAAAIVAAQHSTATLATATAAARETTAGPAGSGTGKAAGDGEGQLRSSDSDAGVVTAGRVCSSSSSGDGVGGTSQITLPASRLHATPAATHPASAATRAATNATSGAAAAGVSELKGSSAVASSSAVAGSSAAAAAAAGNPVVTSLHPGGGGGAAAAAAGSSVPRPRGKVCAGCGLLFPKLFKCAGCAAAGVYTGYCSAECQVKAWPAHKKECKGKGKKKNIKCSSC